MIVVAVRVFIYWNVNSSYKVVNFIAFLLELLIKCKVKSKKV